MVVYGILKMYIQELAKSIFFQIFNKQFLFGRLFGNTQLHLLMKLFRLMQYKSKYFDKNMSKYYFWLGNGMVYIFSLFFISFSNNGFRGHIDMDFAFQADLLQFYFSASSSPPFALSLFSFLFVTPINISSYP